MKRRSLYAPGPFPPVDPVESFVEDDALDDGSGRADLDASQSATGAYVDLGAVFRDQLFTAHHMDGTARNALQARLKAAVESGDFNRAADVLTAWADTWSLSAMIDDANEQWSTAPDGPSLAVLARAADIVGMALEWQPAPNGPWPWPDAEALRAAVGPVDPARDVVLRRHPLDGAERVAAVLGLDVAESGPLDLPAHVTVEPAALVGRRAELAAGLASGAWEAVVLTAEPSGTPAMALARGELRMEGSAQVAVDRYGLAGLLAPDAPQWSDVRGPAPVDATAHVRPDAVFDAACDGALVPGPPGTLRQGGLDTVGVLLFVGPHPPVWVSPVAVHVLRGLNGQRTLGALAEAMGAPLEALLAVVADLVSVGAVARV